ncbi:hypothetical protein FD754_025056, partial [Muntiacus muntjak]
LTCQVCRGASPSPVQVPVNPRFHIQGSHNSVAVFTEKILRVTRFSPSLILWAHGGRGEESPLAGRPARGRARGSLKALGRSYVSVMSEFTDTILSVHPSDVLDMPVDPNEPTYCLCHQVSYGEMIGCDNPDCPIEWFHFACVDLTTKPKGKWSGPCPR